MRFIALSILLAGTIAAANAQTLEEQQRAACTGDAFRLCASSIPDRDRVRDCLIANREQISSACRALLPRARSSVR